jgi:flagellum-specific ATP synthase
MSTRGLNVLSSLRLHPRVGPAVKAGRVVRFDGAIAGVVGCNAPVGSSCEIETTDGHGGCGEVIGFREQETVIALTDGSMRIAAGALVRVVGAADEVPVGAGLLGRVWDADGKPLDGLPPLEAEGLVALRGQQVNPLSRAEVSEPLDVGVRAINGLLSVGRGQRIALIAGSGVGKSVLLSMLCRGTQADVVVAALIGERAREVSGFVQSVLTEESRARTVVVAVTAEQSPILRIRGAHRASAIADYFRSQGKQVLLIVDSLTRVGHAQREIGLALGEQPTAKGYPPSVVSLIPRLVERAGRDRESGGSITAFYTVLADGDDVNDPVVDAARAITDGHIVLSRSLAEQGVYPAIDVAASVSRVSTHICSKSHLDAARVFRRRYSLYQENKDLALMGGYQAGIDREIDLALGRYPQMMNFITQPVDLRCSWDEAQRALAKVVSDD